MHCLPYHGRRYTPGPVTAQTMPDKAGAAWGPEEGHGQLQGARDHHSSAQHLTVCTALSTCAHLCP